MDRYDHLILDIIKTHQSKNGKKDFIRLRMLEEHFMKSIESDQKTAAQNGRIGERITRLYVSGYIENKNGYRLTRKGRGILELSQTEP